jgi:hypothetical protein
VTSVWDAGLLAEKNDDDEEPAGEVCPSSSKESLPHAPLLKNSCSLGASSGRRVVWWGGEEEEEEEEKEEEEEEKEEEGEEEEKEEEGEGGGGLL